MLPATAQSQVRQAMTQCSEAMDDCSVILRGLGLDAIRHVASLADGKKLVATWKKTHDVAQHMAALIEKI